MAATSPFGYLSKFAQLGSKFAEVRILSVLTMLGLLALLLISLIFTSRYSGADAPECRMSYMAPAYAKVNGFDQTHTRFSKKYALYLYREQGRDSNPGDQDSNFLTGTPVLFIPGNAGSYKQVRAIAAECANMYLTEYSGSVADGYNANSQNLDFFTADFNEDLTAFHGRTLLDQSEYLNDAIRFILLMYQYNGSPVSSVIVLGHSMGGIVARTMITLPNYLEGSINTFVTLAAPHSAAPVTFDGDLMKVYGAIDKFWRSGFPRSLKNLSKDWLLASSRLQNISLISITGGMSDSVLPADYTTIKGLVPLKNGFTVYTTGIPGVWTPIDHLAIVWCDQLRKVISRTLLEIIDSSSPSRTYPLEKRMAVFKKYLLPDPKIEIPTFNPQTTVRLKLDNDQISSATPGSRSMVLAAGYLQRGLRLPKVHVFYVPKNGGPFEFSGLSSLPFVPIDKFGGSAKPSILLCRLAASNTAISGTVDFTSDATSKKVELDCIDAHTRAYKVPRSAKSTVSSSESSLGGKFAPFNAVNIDSSTLNEFESVVVVEAPDFNSLDNNSQFLAADLGKENLTSTQVNSKFWQFLLFGVNIKLPAKRPLAVDVRIPAIWSSLIAYKLTVVRQFAPENDPDNEIFAPLIRQWISGIHETKWLMGSNNEPEKLITMHGVAPFVAFDKNHHANSLHLQVWSDSLVINNLITLNLQVDIFSSLRLLVMRFRIVIGVLPVAVVALVLAIQLWTYDKYGTFISFGDGLLTLCKPSYLLTILVSLSVLSLLLTTSFFQMVFYFLDPIGLLSVLDKNAVLDNLSLNPFFLGLEEVSLFLLPPLFFTISIALVTAVYFLTLLLAHGISYIYVDLIYKRWFGTHYTNLSANDSLLKSRRRVIGTILIFGSIPFYFPYQFAYVIIVAVQAVVCVRSIMKSRAFEVPSNIATDKLNYRHDIINFLNFNFSLFMLMLWVLPINIPVLVVFIHNFALKWQTPFSSHHNFLAIVPIFVIIEKNVSGRMIHRTTSRFGRFTTQIILGYFILYAVVYGVRHAWWLHYLLNFFCTWLIFLGWDIFGSNEDPKDTSKRKRDSPYIGMTTKEH